MRPRTVRLIRTAYWIWAMAIGAFAFWMIVLGLQGCGSTSIQHVMAPDGYGAYYVRCSDHVRCLEEGQRACPRGYYVISQGSSQGAVAMQWGAVTTVSPTTNSAMMIRCR